MNDTNASKKIPQDNHWTIFKLSWCM